MALEVANEGYVFLPRVREPSQHVFRHNPLHDADSIWWLAC